MVSGFSTASYLKVHVKTHHSSSMLPSSAAHQFPEPRTNRPQMHNGAPYHSGRQCAVEGKLASPHSVKLLLAHLLSFSLLLIRCCICLHNSHANTDCSAAHLSSLLQNYFAANQGYVVQNWAFLIYIAPSFGTFLSVDKDVCC